MAQAVCLLGAWTAQLHDYCVFVWWLYPLPLLPPSNSAPLAIVLLNTPCDTLLPIIKQIWKSCECVHCEDDVVSYRDPTMPMTD